MKGVELCVTGRVWSHGPVVIITAKNIQSCYSVDQLTYTAPEVENLKRSFPSGYAYETRACEVGAVQNAHFTVALGVF